MEDIKLAAAIILYNPEEKITEYILKLRQYFPTIYLFDNTESEERTNRTREKVRKKGIKYKAKNNNMGLAYGLNSCCNVAFKDGFDWIMLFDQDSVVTEDLVGNMKEFIKKYDEEKLAIVAPMIDDFNNRKVKEQRVKRKKEVITSGMILKLKAFKENGLFSNQLFLDAVDIEFCLRLSMNGYYILENSSVALQHNQFDNEKVLGGYKVNKYSAIRYYYMSRGYFYLLEHYKNEKIYLEQFKNDNFRRLWGMMFYDKHKIKKILAVLLGYVDYKLNRFGKCKWKILM